jgi:pyrroline-5-carboxylate reductase
MRYEAAFIGAGNMGGALLERVCQAIDPACVAVYRPNRQAGQAQCARLGCALASSGADAVREAKYIFLCVKPQVLPQVLSDLLPALSENQAAGGRPVLVSIAAGVPLEKLSELLQAGGLDLPVVRVMPNTPAAIGQGVLLLAPAEMVSEDDLGGLERLLSACGLLERVTQRELDLGMSIAGCGPAFVYLFIEALADGGVQLGLPRAKAQTWAAQMVAGAAGMVLQTGKHPGQLKDEVCSPGGTTIAGVAELEKRAFRSAAAQAVVAAYEKNSKLSK